MPKDPKLIFHTTHPDNAEPELDKLTESFITPFEQFYIRNHGEIPDIDPVQFRLQIGGMVNQKTELTLDDLKNKFQKHTVMATLQCAGNRRTELVAHAPVPGEVPWREGAIGNATWSGAKLKDVLNFVGVNKEALFVEFIGAEEVIRHEKNVGFGASIPIDKALSDDVLLAYEMNGKPLEPTHGFPLRAVVPGYIGARSVKWLVQITLQDTPSKNYFQDHAYRLFGPEVTPDNVDWEAGIQLSEVGLNCVITSPKSEEAVSGPVVAAKGFAIGKGGKKIERVEISIDEGQNWIVAQITEGQKEWAWSFWEARVNLPKGTHEIISRAFDEAAHSQPEQVAEVWNFKGYMNNAWHRVKVHVE